MEPFIIVYAVIFGAFILFILGPWKYDLVALIALMILSILGIISAEDIFSGFAHPAVWTVIGVLIISKGLINSGLINIISRKLDFVGTKTRNQVGVLTFITGLLSGFINNIGALASLIPIAKTMAKKSNNISKILMPMAFASLLGGTITLIGTPPNIIIALFRAEATGQPFMIFDFFPVGFGVAFAGIAFISLIGYKLVPKTKDPADNMLKVENYKAEIIIDKESKSEGKTLGELLKISGADVKIDSIISKGRLITNPSKKTRLERGNILIVKGSADEISSFVDVTGLKYSSSKELRLFSEEDLIVEAVISSKSILSNKRLETSLAHKRFNIKILSVAHYEKKTQKVSKTVLHEGDIIVFQGSEENINRAMKELNCQPVKERGIRFGQAPRLIPALLILLTAILASFFRILSPEVAFMTAGVIMIITKLTTIKETYETSIDWSVIVLLGAMIPVGMALDSTGGARIISDWGLSLIGNFSPWIILLFLMSFTMLLSNTIDNISTAVLMAPISAGIALGMNASIDPFLMAVAVAASTPFLTPIGHQSCSLVMIEGGYKFKDYWRLGLPLSIIVLTVSIPLILHFWPL